MNSLLDYNYETMFVLADEVEGVLDGTSLTQSKAHQSLPERLRQLAQEVIEFDQYYQKDQSLQHLGFADTQYVSFNGEKLQLVENTSLDLTHDPKVFCQKIQEGLNTQIEVAVWKAFSSFTEQIHISLDKAIDGLVSQDITQAEYLSEPVFIFKDNNFSLSKDQQFIYDDTKSPINFLESIRKGENAMIKQEVWEDFINEDHSQSWMLDEDDMKFTSVINQKLDKLIDDNSLNEKKQPTLQASTSTRKFKDIDLDM